ncbi:MAG: YkvA family protein [Myxococcota bacterium]
MSGKKKTGGKGGTVAVRTLSPEEAREIVDRLRKRIDGWARRHAGAAASHVLLAGPDLFMLLSRLVRDSRVPAREKIKLGAALAYFIAPLDFVPEMLLGPLGYVDDVVLAAYVLEQFVNEQDPALIKAHWPGKEQAIRVIQRVLKLAKTVLGGPLWDRLRQVK